MVVVRGNFVAIYTYFLFSERWNICDFLFGLRICVDYELFEISAIYVVYFAKWGTHGKYTRINIS